MSEAAGLYISVPFCRAKCTFCNFRSDAFAPELLPAYVHELEREMDGVRARVNALGAALPERVDTVYLGGGTPSLLAPAAIGSIFGALRRRFLVDTDAEITVECAPGQLSEASLAEFRRQGVNRMSFGVQSFVDAETRGVGRSHTAAECLADLARVRAAGIEDVSVDLIAGLPGQTESSWQSSLDAVIAAEVPHASVYLLEVDEDSRLGREVLRGGARYGAAGVPSEDLCVDLYEQACAALEKAGVAQYEISNFARAGRRSRHNLKYWQRAPYLGFGLDAHSMLRLEGPEAIRFRNTGELAGYLRAMGAGERASGPLTVVGGGDADAVERIGRRAALEEAFFLGLRLNDGLGLGELRACFGESVVRSFDATLEAAACDGLLEFARAGTAERVRLTRRGRALSNEVFTRLLLVESAAA